MTNLFSTELIKQHPTNQARITKITTPHGEIITPAFMPVATRAYINHVTPRELLEIGSQIILGGNTYHMLCAPGLETIQNAGGMHAFMNWHKPMLTDSGGYQVFSLSQNAKICKIDEEGATFKHPTTGKKIRLTPEISLQTQKIIGADIIMAFDECTPDQGGREAAVQAMQRTHRWLIQSKEAHVAQPHSAYGFRQALFGIVQGGRFQDLREESAEFILNLDLDGFAIGGESIGSDMAMTQTIMDWLAPVLPKNKTRYSMGVGLSPQDLIDVVAKGMDIFDCVAPTRNARHGTLYYGKIVKEGNWLRFDSGKEQRGRILIKKSEFAKDYRPIVEDCFCFTCQNFTRAYLHYLSKTKLPLYGHLACIHNLAMMHKVCDAMRESILNN